MKKILLLIPLIIIACKKEADVKVQDKDSTVITEQPNPESKQDSGAIIKKDLTVGKTSVSKEITRSEKDGQIIRTAEASQLPFSFEDTFTKDNQGLILKITNYNRDNIKAIISTEEKDFNIRFNQIKLPDGEYDGPFGREIDYEIKAKGEVWLIIGKSNMASGNTQGNFKVNVE